MFHITCRHVAGMLPIFVFPPCTVRRLDFMNNQELLDQQSVLLARWVAVTPHGLAYPVSSAGHAQDILRHCLCLSLRLMCILSTLRGSDAMALLCQQHPVNRVVP